MVPDAIGLQYINQSTGQISLLLTVLGYVPSIVYSVYVILKTPPDLPGIDGDRPY